MHFICSGLIQYSFFAALRFRILRYMQKNESRESALHNLRYMQHILYREDPEQIMSTYIQHILSAKLDLADPVPEDVQDLLKTALPADFHNSPRLEWRYIVLNGCVWQIDTAPAHYIPQSADEKAILEMIAPEPNPFNEGRDTPAREEEEEKESAQANSLIR
jgi:hypothetical protein